MTQISLLTGFPSGTAAHPAPDLAVLLQKDLFNTDIDGLLEHVTGRSRMLACRSNAIAGPARQIHDWRKIIWDVMGDSIYQRVQSFSELATALYSFSAARSSGGTSPWPRGPPAFSA